MAETLLEELSSGPAPPLVPLTVDQLNEMINAGIVPAGSSMELIDGILVYKDRSATGNDPMTYNPKHAGLVRRLVQRLSKWCESDRTGCFVQTQLPVALTAICAPEPDVAIIVGIPDSYANRHPGAGDIAAVVEVADSSLRYDRTTKLRLYSSAGIPTYWIINLPEGKIEVHLRPEIQKGFYSERTEYRPGQSIPLKIGQHVLDVDVAALLA
jgi:Uma2 family endonuclease